MRISTLDYYHGKKSRPLPVFSMAFCRGVFVTGTLNGELKINYETQKYSLNEQKGTILSVKFSKDGGLLAAASDEKSVFIYIIDYEKQKQEIYKKIERFKADVIEICFFAGFFVACDVSGVVYIYDATSFEFLKSFSLNEECKGMCADPLESVLVVQLATKLNFYDKSLNAIQSVGYNTNIPGVFEGYFARSSFDPSGGMLALALSFNKNCVSTEILQRKTFERVFSVVGHVAPSEVVRFFPSHLLHQDQTLDILAVASQDRSISLWSTRQPRPFLLLKDLFNGPILDMQWDGFDLYASSYDSSIKKISFDPSEFGRTVLPVVSRSNELSCVNFSMQNIYINENGLEHALFPKTETQRTYYSDRLKSIKREEGKIKAEFPRNWRLTEKIQLKNANYKNKHFKCAIKENSQQIFRFSEGVIEAKNKKCSNMSRRVSLMSIETIYHSKNPIKSVLRPETNKNIEKFSFSEQNDIDKPEMTNINNNKLYSINYESFYNSPIRFNTKSALFYNKFADSSIRKTGKKAFKEIQNHHFLFSNKSNGGFSEYLLQKPDKVLKETQIQHCKKSNDHYHESAVASLMSNSHEYCKLNRQHSTQFCRQKGHYNNFSQICKFKFSNEAPNSLNFSSFDDFLVSIDGFNASLKRSRKTLKNPLDIKLPSTFKALFPPVRSSEDPLFKKSTKPENINSPKENNPITLKSGLNNISKVSLEEIIVKENSEPEKNQLKSDKKELMKKNQIESKLIKGKQGAQTPKTNFLVRDPKTTGIHEPKADLSENRENKRFHKNELEDLSTKKVNSYKNNANIKTIEKVSEEIKKKKRITPVLIEPLIQKNSSIKDPGRPNFILFQRQIQSNIYKEGQKIPHNYTSIADMYTIQIENPEMGLISILRYDEIYYTIFIPKIIMCIHSKTNLCIVSEQNKSHKVSTYSIRTGCIILPTIIYINVIFIDILGNNLLVVTSDYDVEVFNLKKRKKTVSTKLASGDDLLNIKLHKKLFIVAKYAKSTQIYSKYMKIWFNLDENISNILTGSKSENHIFENQIIQDRTFQKLEYSFRVFEILKNKKLMLKTAREIGKIAYNSTEIDEIIYNIIFNMLKTLIEENLTSECMQIIKKLNENSIFQPLVIEILDYITIQAKYKKK